MKDMLDEIVKIHGEKFRTIIENLPINKQRIAMFALLCSKKDKDLQMMIKDIETLNMSKIDKVLERIRIYIGIGEVEKKSFGEVFTPFKLINEMLDTLPKDVWSNPTLKWLDPANGIGNFPAAVIKRLMIGLETWEPVEEKRYKHIIENMIYVGELQAKNMFLWMVSVDPKNEYNLNLYRGSFLDKGFDEHMKNVWKIENFDIVVGNPPYQELSDSEDKNSNQSRKKLWMIFAEKSLEISDKLLFVTPNNWLYKTCYLFDIFQPKLQYAEIDTEYLQSNYFKGVGSTFSYYLLDNNNTKECEMSVSKNKVVASINVCPTKTINSKSISIFNKVFSANVEKFNMTREKYERIKNLENVIYIERSKSNGVLNANENLVNTTSYWLEIENETERNNTMLLLNSKLYKFCIKNLRSGMAIVSSINFLPNIKLTNDQDIYEFFNISDEEILVVENN